MKHIFLLIFAVMLFNSFFAEWIEIDQNTSNKLFEVISDDEISTELEFNLDGYEMETITENGENYHKITYKNEGEFLQVGKPDLPRFTRLIAIPNTGKVTYEILDKEEMTIADMNIFPRQQLISESRQADRSFTVDEDYYKTGDVFPKQMIEIGETAIMRDFRIVQLTVNPFQFNPVSKELKIIKNMEIVVNCSGSGGENIKIDNRKKSRNFEKIYSSTILNYDNMITRDTEYQIPCYLFIYPNNMSSNSELQDLMDWKHQKGFEVHGASLSETGSSNSAIKNYIQNAYNNWENPPEFICLIGDANGSYSVPTWFENLSGYGGEGDHPYTQLEGNDILADAIIGRISISSTFQFSTVVDKIFNYEKEPYLDNTQWYTKTLLVGDPGTSGPSTVHTKRNIKEMIDIHTNNFTHQEVYSGSYVSNMTNGMNGGVSCFNYRGYLNMSGWDNNDTNSLNNGYMLPFAISITCGTGSFAEETSVSEGFLRAGSPGAPKGGIGSVGTATWGTHTCFNNCVDSGIFYGVFADKIYNMGGALIRGKLHLYTSYPNNPSNKVNIFSYWNNLMGDPGLELWTSVPEEMDIDYEQVVALGTNYLEVYVHNGGNALEGAWVTALKGEDEIFSTGFTEEDGRIFLPISSSTGGTVSLTVTNHNHIPHLGSFEISQQDVFVNIYDKQIDDDMSGDSNGNNNGLINPGESIELGINLKNFGISAANNVSATIGSNTEFITLSDNEEDYGTINSGNNTYSADDFDFSVDANALGGMQAILDVQINDGSGNEWTDRLYLPVDAPHLDANTYSVIDGNNGYLDPGETAEITVSLENLGTVNAENVTALISSSDENIIITDNTGFYNLINAGNEATNNSDRFELQANSQVIPGTQVPLNIHLTNDDGYDSMVNIMFEIGEVTEQDPLGPDAYGYYCYDDGDEGYDLAPTYDWIEIDPNYGGDGTVINLNDNGDTGDVSTINFPFDLIFYGVRYDEITVCSNGWLTPGETEQESFMNWSIPGPGGPSPIIAPFWDDLKISSGRVCYYYDASMHYYIVEWSHLQNDYNNDEETFQVIIYDADYYPTVTGDCEILFQYETINNTNSGSYGGGYVQHGEYATVGLEDHTSFIGLEYTFSDKYPSAAPDLTNNMALLFTTNGSSVVNPPEISLNQESFEFALLEGNDDTRMLEITNNGEANLIFSISKDYQDDPERFRDSGGPDNYGYTWIDSNEPGGPDYSWRDISGIGTQVTFDQNDTGSDLIPIGFTFDYYGTEYTEFRINPNGWIGFGNDTDLWSNTAIPSSDAPRPALFPLWDDLYPDDGSSISGGDVYYYSSPDSLIIWFDDVIHYPGQHNGTYNFETIIYPDGNILFQYSSVSGDIDTNTIGIQNELGNDGLQVVFNQNYVENNLAILFEKVTDWLDVSPSNGFVSAGQTETITLTASSDELELGDYLCNLYLNSNDPENGQILISVNLSLVTIFPDIDVSSMTIDFDQQFIENTYYDTLIVSNIGVNPLNVSDVYVGNEAYTIDITEFILQPAETQEIVITFTPNAVGEYNTILTIISDDPDESTLELPLLGEGIESISADDELTLITTIGQNYPNPFNPETSINYSLSKKGNVKIEIFNIRGQKVKTLLNKETNAGLHQINWNGTDDDNKQISSGIYYYRFEADNKKMMRKMLLLK